MSTPKIRMGLPFPQATKIPLNQAIQSFSIKGMSPQEAQAIANATQGGAAGLPPGTGSK